MQITQFGKTKIGIDLALTWLKAEAVDTVIVVTKKSLIKNWTDEIRFHTSFDARVLGQNGASNYYALNSPVRLYLTHYEVLKAEEKRLLLFQKTRRVGVILDESQKIKNPDSALTQTLFRLSAGFTRRVIMSGTPVANRPYDIWAQVYFLDQGKALGVSFEEFERSLDLSNALVTNETARMEFEAAAAAVFEKINSFSIRETKKTAGIHLPAKTIENVSVDLETQQRVVYDRYQKELQVQIIRNGELITDNAEDILKRLLRLVQIASNPALVDESYVGPPGKLAELQLLVERVVAENAKVIVWTSFVENAQWLGKVLSGHGSVVVHGHKSIADRNSAIEKFKVDSTVRILVATPGAAKEGLTLTVANYAIW